MNKFRGKRICLFPQVHGVGGMVSFQHKMSLGLRRLGVEVCYELKNKPYDALLIIGGTHQLYDLWHLHKKGIPIVQRLDGMNWMHRLRRSGQFGSFSYKHYLRAEYGNFVLRVIRSRIATFIVYQSNFTKEWWMKVYGETIASNTVIHNGVDLDFFKPDNNRVPAQDSLRFLMIEGGFGGGYEFGLEVAGRAVKELIQRYNHKVDFILAGKISSSLEKKVNQQLQDELSNGNLKINWLGVVPHDEIPKLHQSAHFLFASDINAACPNTVIEAMASGLPVVSYNTGAIKELVKGNAGVVVPYGGDPWKLEQPDIHGLTDAMDEVYRNQTLFRPAARQLAVQEFGLKQMVQSYLEVLLD